jgi:mitochondrial import inner membrane translocase subunit TIM50
VDYFLAYLSQFYEIVVWTTQHHYTAAPILEKLDPYHFFIQYQLFREATRASADGVVKDLSYLNRDLSKVVVLETDPSVVSTHPGNSVIVPKWTGERSDRGLVALIPFLESIGIYNPADVRPILEAYRGKDIPIEYAKTEAAAKQKHIEEFHARGGKGLGGGGLTLTGMFGSSGAPKGGAVPPTYLEMKRAEAQALYRQEQAYIAEHKAEFDRLLEEDRQAAMREGAGSMLSFMQSVAGGAPAPGQEPAGSNAGAGTTAAPSGTPVPVASK